MDFKISYDNLKHLLNVFYNSTYKSAIPYIEMLHNLKEEGSGLTLKQKVDLEVALANKPKAEE